MRKSLETMVFLTLVRSQLPSAEDGYRYALTGVLCHI